MIRLAFVGPRKIARDHPLPVFVADAVQFGRRTETDAFRDAA